MGNYGHFSVRYFHLQNFVFIRKYLVVRKFVSLCKLDHLVSCSLNEDNNNEENKLSRPLQKNDEF